MICKFYYSHSIFELYLWLIYALNSIPNGDFEPTFPPIISFIKNFIAENVAKSVAKWCYVVVGLNVKPHSRFLDKYP